jgi:hypothetical protein
MCKVERIEDYTVTKLFEPSSESPLDDETHIPILSGGFTTNSQNHMVLAIPASGGLGMTGNALAISV